MQRSACLLVLAVTLTGCRDGVVPTAPARALVPSAVTAPRSYVSLLPPVVAPQYGRIVLNGDEWAFRDQSILQGTGGADFARNVARFFVGDRQGRFLIASDYYALVGEPLADALRAAGHRVEIRPGTAVTAQGLDSLRAFDGVFVEGGGAPEPALLADYVRGGGKVYVGGGSGHYGNSPALEAAHWNVLLEPFGLRMLPAWVPSSGFITYGGSNPLVAGLGTVFEEWGNPVARVRDDDPTTEIVAVRGEQALLATFDAGRAGPVAAFTAPASLVEGDTLTLDASASQNAASFAWTFEDGTTASGPRATHVAVDDGTLRARLVVTSRGGGADTLVRTVTVTNAAPVVTVAALGRVTSGAAIAPVVWFSDRGVRDATWRGRVTWSDLADRSTSAAAQGAVDASRATCGAGTRTLSVAVTDKDGATGTATASVEVVAAPIAIDVQYGDAVGSIKVGSTGPAELPVAVFGSAALDVRTLDVASLRLGDGRGTGTPVATKQNGTRYASYEDVNKDGVVDLVLHVERRALIANGDLSSATTALQLWGTRGGCAAVRGSDVVRVIP